MSALSDLGTLLGAADGSVVGVRHDSRTVEAGDAFVALTGETHDGAAFVAQALSRGAALIVSEAALPQVPSQLLVENARRALPELAHRIYGAPTSQLSLVGITGTNGKTTTSHILYEALQRIGAQPALMGTIAYRGPGFSEAASHTTPEADVLARFARRCVDSKATHLVMEVSSHALVQYRADHARFSVAALTNLTRDHLDYHGSFEAYVAAKERLFLELEPKVSVVTIDGAPGRALATRLRERKQCLLTVSSKVAVDAERSAEDGADFRVLKATQTRDSLTATVATPEGTVELTSPLIGGHNLENLLVALACAHALEQPVASVAEAMSHVRGAAGRLERVPHPRGALVLVDYAHTPDALERVLETIRPLTAGRLWLVFGCGGDRDPGKRPMMGRAAAVGASHVVLTDDNPRSESAEQIVAGVLPGLADGGMPRATTATELASAPRGFLVEHDRAAAISLAVQQLVEDDTLLIAGKGHEKFQLMGTGPAARRSFDDRQEAEKAIAATEDRTPPAETH